MYNNRLSTDTSVFLLNQPSNSEAETFFEIDICNLFGLEILRWHFKIERWGGWTVKEFGESFYVTQFYQFYRPILPRQSTKKADDHGDVMIENAHTAHYKFSANQL